MSTPHFEATVRGGRGSFHVLRKVRVEFDAPRVLNRFVFLVHGYNVSEDAAIAEFEHFNASVTRRVAALRGQVGYFIWPGDYSDPVSRASYPWRVGTARRCAPKLAEYLESLRTPGGATPQIVIVAHSLGCRLALEAVHAASDRVRRNTTLILMAAAYPVGRVEGPMTMSIRSTRSSVVLYSESDEILSSWFAVGELAAGWGGGGIPEAVGLFGRPTRRAWSERRSMAGFRHGDYWKSDAVHGHVCRILGFATDFALQERKIREATFKERSLGARLLRRRALRS